MKTRNLLPLIVGAIAAPQAHADDAADNAPVRMLGSVTVTATRPTSLPSHIPMTIEGITGKQIAETINATDSEDALKYFPSLLVRKRYVGRLCHPQCPKSSRCTPKSRPSARISRSTAAPIATLGWQRARPQRKCATHGIVGPPEVR